MSTSEECINDCIGQGFNFCPVTNKTVGYCCKSEVDCPRETVCSYDSISTLQRIKVWTCPQESFCNGGIFTVLDFFGSSSLMSTYFSSARKDNLVRYNSCNYEIAPPPVAKKGDMIRVKVWKADYCKVRVTYGESYETAQEYLTMKEGSQLFFPHPQKVWLTVYGTSILFASFYIESSWVRTHDEATYNFSELDKYSVGGYEFSGFSIDTNYT